MAERDPNRDALVRIAHELGSLRDEFVFVGGATVGLYITDAAAPPVRPTYDIDVIVEVATRAEYDYRICEALIVRGFSELRGEGMPVCAWQKGRIRLDVMPTNEAILGFSNHWYRPAIEHAQTMDLGSVSILIASPPYFPLFRFTMAPGIAGKMVSSRVGGGASRIFSTAPIFWVWSHNLF